ncbi:efflux RND transporter periplasmic adaptor subunit [Lysobacter sp. SG-8]|uniref:Efflux RND transporter periplasmic adaptor subunit n=1 Tax=Marilutibacter penaei TaxID=2759900 RepID=A0A7W3YFU9_9GAMM|nr:efflux RND transporter periplasmic adaptor subunit [Lysobacter penaei]MBB1089642.1 efflux RND transporter periplasmic adaptor subunit [Lysobacter penaei]
MTRLPSRSLPQPRATRRRARAGAGPSRPAWGLALLASAVLAGCGTQANPSAAMPPPEVSVARVVEREVRPWDDFTGRVRAVETVELRPRVSGYVERVAFTEGDVVAKGDLLFVIDPRHYRAELERAQAELARARSESDLARTQHARAQSLVEAKAISREEFESRRAARSQADAAVRAADAALDRARLDLQFAEVRAPISGRIGQARVTAGNLAQADATVLTTLVSLDPVHVYFEADERTWQGYADVLGRPVKVGLSGEDGHPHAGTLDFIDNQVDAGTGTLRARAVVANPDGALTPGQFARVQLQGGQSREALLVDRQAVLTDQDRKYVYVMGEDSTAARRDIQLGRDVGGLREVLAGLQADDRVIVHGLQKVFFPGMPVAPVEVEMGAPPAGPPVASADPAHPGGAGGGR